MGSHLHPWPWVPPLSSGTIRTAVQLQLSLQTQHPARLLHPSTATFTFPSLPRFPRQKGEVRKHLLNFRLWLSSWCR